MRQEAFVGFVLGMIRQRQLDHESLDTERWWHSILFVDPDHRGRCLGTALLQRVIDFVDAHDREVELASNYTPYYVFPGPDVDRHADAIELLSATGFKSVNRPVAMDGEFRESAIETDLPEREARFGGRNITVEEIAPRHVPGLLSMLRREFSPDWVRAARTHLRTESWEEVLVAMHAGQVVGWCQWGTIEPGRFGPYGVAETSEVGIVAVLFHRCLQRMREREIRTAGLQWTGLGGATALVYRLMGFETTRQLQIMEYQIP